MPRPLRKTLTAPRRRRFRDMGTTEERHGPLLVEMQWADIDGRAECVGVSVWHGVRPRRKDDETWYEALDDVVPRSVGTSDLRIPIAPWLRKHREAMYSVVGGAGAEKAFRTGQLPDGVAAYKTPWFPSTGGRGYPKAHYEAVAAKYREGLAKGLHPTKYVALQLGVTRTTAAKWIQRCRRDGLLGPAQHGRAGETAT